jgi:hypothetical protein
MSDESRKPFLSRWSQRKLAASREASVREASASVAPPVPKPPETASTPAAQVPAAEVARELPPVESLSFDSDFAQFMQPKVDESLKRQALRKLFNDPRFNVMDGLDVYIDDYTKFVPMTPDIVAQLNHAKFLFDPPKTRINAQGYAEDVPPEPPGVRDPNDDAEAGQPALDAQAQQGEGANVAIADEGLSGDEPLIGQPIVSPAAKQSA